MRDIHRCHAIECDTPVPPRLLMCNVHWRMVPKANKDAVLATYRPGQEIDKLPSEQYIKAARGAINAVAIKERKPTTANPFLLLESPTQADEGKE